MANRKRSITRDSVFKTTGSDAPAPQQGIPKQETHMHQTAVWLADEETQWIDEQCQQIKKGGWRSVTRSAFIRALIRASMEKQTDLKGVTGEAELTERLSR
jgi:hypothetical protein